MPFSTYSPTDNFGKIYFSMNKYLAYFKSSFKLNTAYKANFGIRLVTDIVWFFIFFTLWTTIYTKNQIDSIQSYTLTSIITYYFVTEFIFKFDVAQSIYLNWTVWSGYFSNDLVKPWNVPIIYIIDAVTERFLVILMAIPVFAIIYFFIHQYIVFPNMLNMALFIVTLILSFLLNICFNLIFHTLVFKYGDQEGTIELVNYIAIFFAGGFFPIAFLPQGLKFLFELLPFKYLYYVPANIFLGKLSVDQIVASWVAIIAWSALFYSIFYHFYKKGLKFYTGVGR